MKQIKIKAHNNSIRKIFKKENMLIQFYPNYDSGFIIVPKDFMKYLTDI